MNCPACSQPSPDDARFCMHCAAPFASACKSCGAEFPAGARFCPQCAQPAAGADVASPAANAPGRDPREYTPRHLADKILQSKSALEGERKQVTVLFADVRGSMTLTEELGAEDWHSLMDRFFQILSEGVHRFEGTINQYTGDGIMAIFGAPIAHENHAQRACYAALYLADALKEYTDALRVAQGLNLSIRMGINSGEVVVGRIGDDLRMDYTAQGHTVGLAQRMEALAEPGKALLAGATIEIVEGYFELHDLGEAQVKGVEHPVRIAELAGTGPMRTRLDRSRARGLSKFVGRAEEMARLDSALESAVGGNGQVIGVVADAGSGKSRLCHELAEKARSRGIAVRMSQGVPHGNAVPLEPILQFYREIFSLEEGDGDREARQKIAGLIAQSIPDAIESLPLFFDFMRVPDPARPAPELAPDERRRALLDLLRRLTVARSETAPAVLIFEDLHWIDPESAEVIEGLVDTAADTRTLMIVNFRPEFRADWTGRSHYQQIALRPLDGDAAAELLADWLGRDPSLEGLVELVVERTGGNPFFMEEVVQAEIESGALAGTRGHYKLQRPIASIEVPASVQSLLAARIDRLGDDEKRLLQTAAVIGQEQPEPLLADVAGCDPDSLRLLVRTLVQSEFLYEQSLYPELEYAFKHPLTREVSYGSLLRDRRHQIHVATAKALEKRESGDALRRTTLLAHHWAEGGRPVEASRWHLKAISVLGVGGTRESLFAARKVIELLENEEATQEIDEMLGSARATLIYAAARSEMPEEEVKELFQSALRRLGEGDSRAKCMTLRGYAVVRSGVGARDEAIELVTEAIEQARRLNQPDLTADCLCYRMLVVAPLEDPVVVAADFDEIKRIFAAQPDASETVDPINRFLAAGLGSLAYCSLGRASEVEQDPQRFLDALPDDNNAIAMAGALLSIVLLNQGDVTGAVEAAHRAVEGAAKVSNPAPTVISHAALGNACLRAGQLDEAQRCLEHAVDLGRTRGLNQNVGPSYVASLSEVHLQRGDEEQARALADQAVEEAIEQGMLGIQAQTLLQRARVWISLGQADELASARGEIERAEALALERSSQAMLAEAQALRAELAQREGDESELARARDEAVQIYLLCGNQLAADRVKALG